MRVNRFFANAEIFIRRDDFVARAQHGNTPSRIKLPFNIIFKEELPLKFACGLYHEMGDFQKY